MVNIKKELYDDIYNHSIIGLGEGSHGTREYQLLRLKIIQDIYRKFGKEFQLIVFIEDNYFDWKFFNHIKPTKLQPFRNIINDSKIYDFYKSNEFILLLYYLHKHQIPVYGVDVQNVAENTKPTNNLENYILKFNKKIKPNMQNNEINQIRKDAMIYIINDISEKYVNPKNIVLAHNYHVSGYENFPGLRIAMYSQKGTVRVAVYEDGEFIKYAIKKFNYKPIVKKFTIVKTKPNDKRFFQSNSFVLSGEEYDYNAFDYIYMLPKTKAIKIKSEFSY